MQSFNMGRFGSSDDPWFRIGNIDVNTTVFVTAVGVLSMFVYAIEGAGRPLTKYLMLGSRDLDPFTGGNVLGGQIWRLVTWPIPNSVDIWSLLVLAIFFMLGSQLEATMGRRQFTVYLLMMTIIPAVLVTIFGLLTGADGLVAGLRSLEFGVFVGFAVRYPTARFWPGIPAWVMAAIFIGLQFLGDLGRRDYFELFMLFAIVGVSGFSLRALGFAEEAHWIPKLALPAAMTGMSEPRRAPRASSGPSTKRRKRRGKAKLSAVPAPSASTPRRELSKLEEAEMDAILDQVAERGMDSLTPQQRSRLEEHSKRLRRRGE